ncbi:two-component sensor histidine kinase [Asanoa ishikariensis]|uniref:histidine kinase n=1 Tax=Asanoa ishikariensis TaxID=137265 RepID=A0A1H3MJQ6_9ACTN|nr:histidine kinase [Asanoa ishikariensis]GIF66172.1 two-component sensor histidine kinase [Asanoa ishikariensis]SDY76813.1 Signal transduction histidine kinase [Asanoa ishikariensis]
MVEQARRAVRQVTDAAYRLPPLVFDSIIALLCYLATIASPVVDGEDTLTMYAFAALSSLPLAWRRRWPVPVTLVTGCATAFLAVNDLIKEVPFGQLVATYTFASLANPAWRAFGIVGTVVGLSISLTPKNSILPVSASVILFGGAYALGAIARSRRGLIANLEARAEQLAADYAQAAARERERIARDMHDIVAHSVSLIVVQAEAGPVVVRSDPARAVQVFDAIADAGRDALTQLRRTLGVLRSEPATRSPQPGLDGIAPLVEQARVAGLAVTLDETGDRRPIPADTAVAAYRVVQEALTNVVRHARAAQVEVLLRWSDDALVLEVRDDGRGPSRRPGGTGGHGLIGMRERVAACGGTLRTGAATDGPGFLVHATLPVVESVVPARPHG